MPQGRGNPQICIPQFASFLRLRLHQFLRSSGPAFERVRSDHHLSLEVHLLLSTFCCSLLSSLLPRKAYPTPPGGCQFPFSHATGPPHTVPSRFPCVRGACGSFCSGGPVCSSAFALRSDDSFASHGWWPRDRASEQNSHLNASCRVPDVQEPREKERRWLLQGPAPVVEELPVRAFSFSFSFFCEHHAFMQRNRTTKDNPTLSLLHIL